MPTLASLLVEETKAQIYARGLAIATTLGLNVTTWAPGDPTRSLYHFLAEVLEILEPIVAGYIGSGFLDYAEGDWLTILAEQLFDVERTEATYATAVVTLTNAGGGIYVIEAGDITVKSSTSGKTYRNTSGGTLSGSSTLDLDFTADEAGSDSSAAATTIDTMVTTLLGVTCSNALAALGLDEEEDDALRERCRAKLGMLSPNGPADAYDYVVRSSDLTGVTDITRSRTIADSTTGTVTVYVAADDGAVAGASVTAAQLAVDEYATPQCITATVVNAAEMAVAITYEVWLYDSVGELDATIKAQIDEDLVAMFADRPIGGDIIAPSTTGIIAKSLIEATIKAAYPDHIFKVSVTSPAADLGMAINQVAVVDGTPTGTVHQEAAP